MKINLQQFFLLISVPHEPIARAKWKAQIEKHQSFDDIPIAFPVCALHFDEKNIIKCGKKSKLAKGTVPTIFPTM